MSDVVLLGEFSPDPRAFFPIFGLIAGIFALVIGGLISVSVVVAGVFLIEQGTIVPTERWLLGAGIIAITIPVLLFVGFIVWMYKTATSITYRVYTDRIESEGGWLSSGSESVPLSEVVDVSYEQNALAAFFDVGSVQVSTAGEDGTAITVSAVDNSRELFEDIKQLTDDSSGNQQFRTLSSPPQW